MTGSTLTLSGMTERAAAKAPGHPALIQDSDRLTYAELHDAVLRCCAALRVCGIAPGDRVGYLGLNSIDYVILLQATMRIGAVTVAINWRLAPREIAWIVQDAGLALLVTERACAAHAPDGVDVVLIDGATDRRGAFRDWIGEQMPDGGMVPVEPGDTAVQLYTSGTTGHPKGALLTHGSLSAAMRQGTLIGEEWATTRDSDVSLIAMPQFHIGGTGWTLQALNAGATGVILSKPDIAEMLSTVEAQGITKMFAVPAVLAMMLDHPLASTADLSSLRVLLYGASPIAPDVLRRSMALFPNAQFVQMYGATETSGTIVYLPPEDHSVEGTTRMNGCGKPYPQVELRIVDSDGRALPPGEVGEVQVRSPLLMSGYHNLAEATAGAFDGDWYRSGDAGRLDADGYLYLLDRVKDMICSGGENIYPVEVEAVLHDYPDVQDCAVIGVPDARWGEAVKALVVRTPGSTLDAATLIAFARDRIAGFKLPKSVDFVTELPRNPSGKILKRELRKAYWPDGDRTIG